MAESKNIQFDHDEAEKKELMCRIEHLTEENRELKQQIDMDNARSQIADAAYEDVKRRNEILAAQMEVVYLIFGGGNR